MPKIIIPLQKQIVKLDKPPFNDWETFGFTSCSFGQAWPGRLGNRTVVLKKEDKQSNSATLDGIQKLVEQLGCATMKVRMRKVEAEMQRMKGIMDEVYDLLK